jgi:FkbM family methyltransferase
MKKLVKQILKSLNLYNTILKYLEFVNNLGSRRKRKNFYSQLIGKEDLCFDVGANSGNRTEIFLSLGAKVVSIEPQDSCMEELKKRYLNNKNVFLVQKALGEKAGVALMQINSSSTLSSISEEWISKVNESGRFVDSSWQGEQEVEITTLEAVIKEYGLPVFCKIDVEGFEEKVLSGLNTPIKFISFEFAYENIESSIRCLRRLSGIGNYRFNYSTGEDMVYDLKEWISFDEMVNILESFDNLNAWGDLYAKLEDQS